MKIKLLSLTLAVLMAIIFSACDSNKESLQISESTSSIALAESEQGTSELNVVPRTSLSIEDLTELNDGVMPNISYGNNNTVEYIDGVFATFPVFSADDAFEAIRGIGEILGIDNIDTEIKYDKFSSNSIDNIYYFSQYYNGIRILGASITVISNKETGIANYLFSTYQNGYTIDITAAISENEAIDIIQNQYNITVLNEPELIIYDVDSDSVEAALAWEIYTGNDSPSQVYINAYTGEILYAEIPQEVE